MRVRRLVLLTLLASCTSPMARVEKVREQLTTNAPQWDSALPACSARATCASAIATALGAPFDEKKPDQVTAAAVAVLVARDEHGSDVGSPEVWLAAMHKASGAGADALRLAVAREMSQLVSKDAHELNTDDDARVFLGHVAAAIPGACKTYEALAGGADPATMPSEDSPDHSACVQHDLARKGAPGPTYGQGLFRAVAGALALWKAALEALHEGSARMGGAYRAAIDQRLSVLDADTSKIAPKVVEAPVGNLWGHLSQQHNAPLGRDAGYHEPL